jgi:hypothetical protein
MNNTMELFKSNISFIYKSVPYILSFSIGSLLGWKLNNRTADREFLRSKIYSPLYEEIKLMGENVSNFENCYSSGLGQISNSSSVHVNVRNSLLKAGQYKLIPEKLRKDIDSYYESCEEYNKQLSSAYEEIYKIFTEEIRKIKTEEDHKKFLHDNEGRKWRYDEVRKKRISNMCCHVLNLKFLVKGVLPNSIPNLNGCNYLTISSKSEWDNTINTDDLNRNSLSLKDILEKLIELVRQRTVIIKLRDLQNQLKSPENLSKKIEKRIRNPNPLVEKLDI